MNDRLRSLLTYGLLGFGLLVSMTLAVAPLAKSLIEQWSRTDVESRSRLVYSSIQGPVRRALADGDLLRLASILQGVADTTESLR